MEQRLTTRLSHDMPRRRFIKAAAFGSIVTMSGLLAACTAARDDDGEPEVEAETDDEPEVETDDVDEPEDETDDSDEPATEPDDASDDAVDDVAEATDDEIEGVPDDFEPFETGELDLTTMEAEIPAGTLQAEPWDNTWVGEVTDDLFIGITVADAYGGQPREVTAYLCDNDLAIVLNGELDEDDAVTLTDDEAEVELSLVDGEITGTVTLAGEEPVDFSAGEATDEAGVYVAGMEIDEVEVSARWIVLPDGRQRGTSICCSISPRFVICWPCQQRN